jgi:hypothetical protein
MNPNVPAPSTITIDAPPRPSRYLDTRILAQSGMVRIYRGVWHVYVQIADGSRADWLVYALIDPDGTFLDEFEFEQDFSVARCRDLQTCLRLYNALPASECKPG